MSVMTEVHAEEIQGAIGFHGLGAWWLDTFSPDERRQLEEIYRPFGDRHPCPLTQGTRTPWDELPDDLKEICEHETPAKLLTNLASWANTPDLRPLARRIIVEACRRAAIERDALALHDALSQMITIFYRDRSEPKSLEIAIKACERQIQLAPLAAQAWRELMNRDPQLRSALNGKLPPHKGFAQLAIIRRKETNFDESERLENEARRQGWGI